MRLLVWLRSLRRSRENLALPPSRVPPGTSSLAGLLDALDEIADEHAELLDTDVRERVWQAIEQRYVRLESSYEIPKDLGMLSAEANDKLRATLEHHLDNLVTVAEVFNLDTEGKRLRSVLNPEVKSQPHGHSFDYFFGSP